MTTARWVAAFVFTAASCLATQIQTTGQPGSPGTTTTIGGKQLPAPDPQFGGVIKDDAPKSKAWWAPRIVPPKKAPNILLIMMTDDSGFGVPSTFGGVIPTVPSLWSLIFLWRQSRRHRNRGGFRGACRATR